MKDLEVRESEVSGKTFNDLAEDEKLVIEKYDEGWANEVAGYSDWDAATQVAEVVRFHPPLPSFKGAMAGAQRGGLV